MAAVACGPRHASRGKRFEWQAKRAEELMEMGLKRTTWNARCRDSKGFWGTQETVEIWAMFHRKYKVLELHNRRYAWQESSGFKCAQRAPVIVWTAAMAVFVLLLRFDFRLCF